jgi:membrane associated rhomboid family serine protease
MELNSEPRIILFRTPSQAACAELALVLEAQSIPSRQERQGADWVLSVPETAAAAAQAELANYTREKLNGRTVARDPMRAMGSGWPGVIAYIAVIMLLAVAVRQLSFGVEWLAIGRMDSGRLLGGEWWRSVTALTLHADAAHLLGNAAFGAFFFHSVGRYWGSGIGWLAIVATGVLGNILNGWFSPPNHVSIGASTAVFGALGILTAFSWRRGFPAAASARERLAPVIAGLGLLAFTGTGGANTDIGAHLMGFVVGFVSGLVAAYTGVSSRAPVQICCAVGAWSIVIGAWLWGIVAVG